MLVISNTSRREDIFTTEIPNSSLSTLVFSKLVPLTMSKKRPISAIETRVNACKLMRKNWSHFHMLGTYLGALLSYWMFS
jgi:hypothetical protein